MARVKQATREGKRRRRTAELSYAGSPIPAPGAPDEIAGRLPVLGLAALTLVLSLPLFAPWSFWPAAMIVLVPWFAGVCLSRRGPWVMLISYLMAVAFYLVHWRWLYSTTPPGYFAGCLYMAVYYPLAAWPVRHLFRTRAWSPAYTLPIAWVAMESVRSWGTLSFPWFLLGHTQIRLTPMIQTANIAGVYGISFVVAMINGLLLDVMIRWFRRRRTQPDRALHPGRSGDDRSGSDREASPERLIPPVPMAITLALLAVTLAYGFVRLADPPMREGPRVAVLQGDFLLSPIHDPSAPTWYDKRDTYFELIERAGAEAPDLIVLPETPYNPLYLNRELRRLHENEELMARIGEERLERLLHWARWMQTEHDLYREISRELDLTLVVGSLAVEPRPDDVYPDEYRYNSAFVYTPEADEPGRYDKIHLVLFGEYVPFRFNRWLQPVYFWLNSITPWGRDGDEYSLMAGETFTTFEVHDRNDADDAHRFAITICYEDVIPQVFRRFVVDEAGGKRVDFMLNISNDGWFGHGTQQPQHLVNCTFRAVENRVGIARAVNTGVSGFIDPTGVWRDLVPDPDGPPRAGGTGHSTAHIMIDPRVTVYSRHGNVLGAICALLWGLACGHATFLGWKRRRSARRQRATKGTV